MTTNDNGFLAKTSNIFHCKYCDYTTTRKHNFNLHLNSIKHKNNENNDLLAQISKTYNCEFCCKNFKDRAGLWRHKTKDICLKSINNNNHIEVKDPTDKDLIMLLIKENSDLKNVMMKVLENGTHTINNTINNNNSHNKAFNLNFFLNDTCKNAMNITEFVDSIKLDLADLMELGEIGYVESMSKIIAKNLNALDENIRPIHCTDKKRETFYIKDEDKWEKEDEEMKRLRKIILKISNKTFKLLPKYREKYPDYNKAESIYSDEHCKIIIETVVCDKLKDEKIIRNISKVTTISNR